MAGFKRKAVYLVVSVKAMRIVIIVAMSLILRSQLAAQKTTSYIVKAGQVMADVVPAEALYVFPAFKNGTVYFRDASVSAQKLNYQIMLGEMQFIAPNGDTLAIAEPAIIKNIVIDTTVFYYDKAYLQHVAQIDSFKLAVNEVFIQAPYRTRGGYDVPTATSAISTYSSISAVTGMPRLQVRKDVQVQKISNYYIGDKFNHFYRVDKKSFLSLFNSKKEAIQEYLKNNKVDFFNQDDLIKLLKFCVHGAVSPN